MEEYSVVRVVKLFDIYRSFQGSDGVGRAPQIGDIGTIVHVNAPGENYIVESADASGCTIWLADFALEELEQISTMSRRVDKITADLSQVAGDAKAAFGALTAEQLNWQPAENSWSVAQCFDHLITTHSLYFPLFERLEKGNVKRSVWETVSPLSGFFGRFLIKAMRPENPKKMKTTARAKPSASQIDGRIIERFGEHQQLMIDHLQKLPPDLDPVKIVITSPLLGLVTYSLDDCLTMLAVHGQRHLGQAKRVLDVEGFPRHDI
jgi:uncharacterized damage-inducible protein DinB